METTQVTMVIGSCYGCGDEVVECAECVNVIRIDPDTGMPPDVVYDSAGTPVTVVPDLAAMHRAEQRLICDSCIEVRNMVKPERPIMTARERHLTVHV